MEATSDAAAYSVQTHSTMPEYLLAALASALLGWGAYVTKRTDTALHRAQQAQDAVDRIELKVAEHYVTKNEFAATVERLQG